MQTQKIEDKQLKKLQADMSQLNVFFEDPWWIHCRIDKDKLGILSCEIVSYSENLQIICSCQSMKFFSEINQVGFKFRWEYDRMVNLYNNSENISNVFQIPKSSGKNM